MSTPPDPAADATLTATASAYTPPEPGSPQRVVKLRRDYNHWVGNETLEDYALRFTPRSFRKWSELRVGNTAFGSASFLVLEAVGATMLVAYGFINTFWAVLAIGLIIFLTALPISIHAARYGVDMDLLTRGSGFGYIGSTISSLVYASFTFILFALEAAIMAYALELAFGIPPAWGYLISALVVIPLVTHGVTVISRIQTFSQPLWLLLLALPFVFLLSDDPQALAGLWTYPGHEGDGSFAWPQFAAAMTVGIALITQSGEQADYLRFMPECTPANRRRWWAGVVLGGPGWVVVGVLKMLGGAYLAWLLLGAGVPEAKAVDPNQMYLLGFGEVFDNATVAVAVTALFVIVSQLKINVTNAYAGSLAWSNFFSRLTHSHPGRVVWVVFNVLIGLILMEMEVFQALGQVLGLYANVAISWMVAVVADLVINKRMGWSPPGIEFRRSHLYDINPVGVGAMLVASVASVATFVGLFGDDWQPFAPFVAMAVAMTVSPLIAWATQGRYYLARPATAHAGPATRRQTCTVCGEAFEREDISHCPAYGGAICSLCCSLDVRCEDRCKPDARLSAQWAQLLERVLPRRLRPYLSGGLGHYLLLMLAFTLLLAAMLGLIYVHEAGTLGAPQDGALADVFARLFVVLWLISGVGAWWMVLTQQSRRVAQAESDRQNQLLRAEIASHSRTDAALQQAKRLAEQANQAKSRYITAISHELRTPLNSILGYAQILDADADVPPNRRQAVAVIRRSGDHLLSLIEGTLDIARIESGKLTLDMRALDLPAFLQQIVAMFELQARERGLGFRYRVNGELPRWVRADERRLRQILINVIGNAVKFTVRGGVELVVSYQREIARFEVIDTGPGIAADDLARLFEPFERGAQTQTAGNGVGLTIARMLTDLMGGEMQVDSQPGEGSRFCMRVFVPQLAHGPEHAPVPDRQRVGYRGRRQRLLVVDNEKVDRDFIQNLLEPLGFLVEQAASGEACLDMFETFSPPPDLVFMDLGMPGIDGWETLRRLRARPGPLPYLAVLSANAFDQNLDNDCGIGPEDFIVKPVRVAQLLDWLGRRLALEWVWADAPVVPDAPAAGEAVAAPMIAPDAEHVAALQAAIDLGYVRGIREQLDRIAALAPRHAEFVRVLRAHAQQFQFETMSELLRQLRHGGGPRA